MKKLFLLIPMLMLGAGGCNDDEKDDISVNSCNLGKKVNYVISSVTTCVFINDDIGEYTNDNSNYILYDATTDIATLVVKEGSAISFLEVCNFPSELKNLNIPENGLRVIISGNVYNDDRNHGIQPAIYSYFYLELTSLIKT